MYFDKVRGRGAGQGLEEGRGMYSTKWLNHFRRPWPFITSQEPVLPFYHVFPHGESNNRLKIIAGVTRSVASGATEPLAQNLAPCLKRTEERLFHFTQIIDQNRENWLVYESLSTALYLPYRKRKAFYFSDSVTPPWVALIRGHSRIFRVFFGGFRGER